MDIRKTTTLLLLAVLSVSAAVAHAQQDQAAARRLAQDMIDSAGVAGGFVLELGIGDGKLAAALHADERFTVHGLDRDPQRVAAVRRDLQQAGVYGAVSVECLHTSRLPYADRLINLAVIQDERLVPIEEVRRVMAPGGVIWRRHGDRWEKEVQVWPKTIGEWTHFLHDASNNAVVDDREVGVPQSLQWMAPPLWLRSHETPSGIQAPVSASGRMFYVLDEGLIGITDERIPDRWSLVARDAFNGKLLWKRPLEDWGWRAWAYDRFAGKDWTVLRGTRTDVPAENQRRLVAVGDRVLATLSYEAPLSILDAKTGNLIETVPETFPVRELVVSDGIAVVYSAPLQDDAARRRGDDAPPPARLVAVDAVKGDVLWQTPLASIRPLSLACDNGRVVALSGKELVAFDLHEGRSLWRVTPKSGATRTLVAADETIVMQGGSFVEARDARNGQLLWDKKVPSIGGAEGEDLFVINGLVWRGALSVDDQLKPGRKSPNVMLVGWDLQTGEERKKIVAMNVRSPEHHHRCYRNKATCRYLISSLEGAEFLDLVDQQHSQNNWLRGVCRYGMLPCNGLLYVPPDQCFCEPGAKLLGFTALKSTPASRPEPVADARRLERGPAYGNVERSSDVAVTRDDWPTYRHDAARHGTTPTPVAAEVRPEWKVQLQAPLTAPVAAENRVYVAAIDQHTLYALDIETGRPVWTFTAGGRIDSPPTVHDGQLLFGSRDGYVYCLRASDGALAWRFLAAVVDERIGSDDQLESVWPVFGSVLVDDGIAYVTAGRSTYLDGGVFLWGLDPATGQIVHRGNLRGGR